MPSNKMRELLDSVPTDAELFEQVQLLLTQTRQGKITGDEVSHHEDVSRKDMVFPHDMTYGTAYKILLQKQAEEEKVTRFTHRFHFRPDDGFHATAQVMKKMFGMTLGKTIRTFFGDRPPQLRTIKIGPGTRDTVQVPEGAVEIPSLEGAVIQLISDGDRDYGQIFVIIVDGPNKYKKIIDTMFAEIQRELEVNSIYRGKALIGANNLDFMDLSNFDPRKIVFATEVEDVLDKALFSPIRYTRAFELDGIPLKRSILLYGPYGTGKTSIGQITAQHAEAHGWTFLSAKTGKDKVEDVLRTARLYQPAVVFVEDIDNQAQGKDEMDVARLLEVFDGMTAKDGQIIMVMTTNHVDKIHRGMLRPGRVDYTVEIAALDGSGVERLIKSVVGEDKLNPAINWDNVYAEMDGFEPAFARATADRAKTWAIGRTAGSGDYVLTEEDLVGAAKSLHPQLALLKAANEGLPKVTISDLIREDITAVVQDQRVVDMDGDANYGVHKMVSSDKDDRSNS